MKGSEVVIGSVYAVKVSGKIAPVRVDSVSPYGGWNATNLRTNKSVRIRGAQKLRFALEAYYPTPNGPRRWRAVEAQVPPKGESNGDTNQKTE